MVKRDLTDSPKRISLYAWKSAPAAFGYLGRTDESAGYYKAVKISENEQMTSHSPMDDFP
jgi:hypothetical protein